MKICSTNRRYPSSRLRERWVCAIVSGCPYIEVILTKRLWQIWGFYEGKEGDNRSKLCRDSALLRLSIAQEYSLTTIWWRFLKHSAFDEEFEVFSNPEESTPNDNPVVFIIRGLARMTSYPFGESPGGRVCGTSPGTVNTYWLLSWCTLNNCANVTIISSK